MTTEWYLLKLSVNVGQESGVDLLGCMEKLKTLLCSYSNSTNCLHKYKVTGEARLVVVFEVTNTIGLERIVAGVARLGGVDVTCKPLILYQQFAEWLGVEKSLTENVDNTLKDDKQLRVYLVEVTVEYPGKSMDELLDTVKREAIAVLTARAKQGHFELFKSVAERKVICLLAMDAADLDALSFQLPLMKENGNGVTLVCHALQNLDSYCSRISAEDECE